MRKNRKISAVFGVNQLYKETIHKDGYNMRKPRQIQEGAIYHVVARINRKQHLFAQKAKGSSSLKKIFLEYVEKAKKKYNFTIQTICIMDNHIHMMIQPGPGSPLANIMKSILGGFACRYNRMFNLKGHVWYDRYKSRIVNTLEQFIRTLAYISNNPVRASIVKSPLSYVYNGITAFCTQSTSEICLLLKRILDINNSELATQFHTIMREYNLDRAQTSDASIGFIDKKPGRPQQK